MKIGEHIHWYVSSRCNMDCTYCFKPDNNYGEDLKQLGTLARILVANNIKNVTITGGEPLVVDGLEHIFNILKDGNVYVSVYTNGTLLDNKRVKKIKGLVDDIGLPLDSVDENTQRALRGENFSFKHVLDIGKLVQENSINLGWHTVFTSLNYKDIPRIYDKIRGTGFRYWRIYEFNKDLAIKRIFEEAKKPGCDHEKLNERFEEIDSLDIYGSPEKGYTDCLLAYFLLMEKEMRKHHDKRIQFVGVRDCPLPYAFLDNSGDISYYTWFSGMERRVLGNIIRDGFPFIVEKLNEVNEKLMDFDDKTADEFVEAISDRPLWARLWDGNFLYEEVEAVDNDFLDDVERMARIFNRREERLIKVG